MVLFGVGKATIVSVMMYYCSHKVKLHDGIAVDTRFPQISFSFPILFRPSTSIYNTIQLFPRFRMNKTSEPDCAFSDQRKK